jgi:hypothetical protein
LTARHRPAYRSASTVSRVKLLFFALLPTVVLLATAELTVRAFGLAETCPDGPEARGGYWTCDPLLQFRIAPTLRPLDEPLNTRGFRGADYDPHAALRILTLGDSCTFGS